MFATGNERDVDGGGGGHDGTDPSGGGGGGTGEGPSRQPNFLQKLFNFLALDPHPFPDVIYWAADSKQLVVARPDELAKNVLPILYKHDKVSSFGRQLNIYGFARVYPGRQFKDANGVVLDASVWAHPTLHRLSTSSEVGAIKRRAAPKLFRTRRLANGQVIRTKAGPEVARKFREIKEDMATERRIKNGWGPSPVNHAPMLQQDTQFAPSDIDDMQGVEQQSMTQDGCEMLEWDSSSGADWGEAPIEGMEQVSQGGVYEQFPSSFEPHQGEDYYRQPLSSIPEGQYAPAYNTHQYPSVVPLYLSPPAIVTDSVPPLSGRFYRSCPASIHTSPVVSPSSLQVPRLFPPSFINQPQQNGLQLRINTDAPMRIAAPAAINPFAAQYANQDHQGAISPEDQQLNELLSSLSSTLHKNNLSATTTPSDGMSRESSVYPEGQSWERTGAIDPRWVSPRGSAWNTPAVTPRSGSPAAQIFPESQVPRGLPVIPGVMEQPSSSTSYGGEGGRPVWGQVVGGMGPPPLPHTRPPPGAQWIV